jgi:predicted ester cyclase
MRKDISEIQGASLEQKRAKRIHRWCWKVARNRINGTIALAIAGTAFCISGQTKQPLKPEGPEQIATWVVEEVWNKGDFRLVPQMFGPHVVLHYRGRDFPLTPESGVQAVQMWRDGFPDFHFKLEDMIVQGNKIALRIPFTGIHLGKFWGLEPTGKKINVTETLILRVEDGKIAEMWEDYDEYGMRIQLGLAKPN